MEAVIIVIILSIVGYVIYASHPNTRFAKGVYLLSAKRFSEASVIFSNLLSAHKDALGKLAETKWQMACKKQSQDEKSAVSIFKEVLALRSKLVRSSNVKLYELYESKAYLGLCAIELKSIRLEKPSNEKIKKLEDSLAFLSKASKTGIQDEFDSLHTSFKELICETHYDLGLQNEKMRDFSKAIFHLEQVVKPSSFISAKLKANAYTRLGICKLRCRLPVPNEAFNHISQADNSFKLDFYYRHAIALIKENKFVSAEEVLVKHLNHKSAAIEKVRTLLAANKMRTAVRDVEEINADLEQVLTGAHKISDVQKLYKKVNERTPSIVAVLPQCQERLSQLNPSLFNRLLFHYLSEESYGNAMEFIENYPFFWTKPELLKNLGICSLHLVATGGLTEDNFRNVISSWLTAIYSDVVLLKSLDDTSWDDPYTFTLVESIGSHYNFHDEMPENVNFDPVSDTNLSIGVTQRELVSEFEALLHQQRFSGTFANTIHDFYAMEKKSIEDLIAIIPNKILFAAPHFAKKHGVSANILVELEEDYQSYNDENALVAGIPYATPTTQNLIGKYAQAMALIDDILKAIDSVDLTRLKSLKKDNYYALLGFFLNVRATAEIRMLDRIDALIARMGENEKLIALMEIVLQISPERGKLQYQYANFVANYCVSRVNSNKISNIEALVLMKNGYTNAMENPRICKNLITIIHFNLMDILNENVAQSQKIYELLDDIHKKRSLTFKQCAQELTDARAKILKELKDAGVNTALLLPSQDSIADLLDTHSLTLQGRTLKKVLQYFQKLGSK